MDENRIHLMGRPRSRLNAGQAIVIVAAAAVALVAIIGLSVDGGRLLLLNRDEQNAGDAATLSSTLALCSGGTEAQIIAAGEAAAAANGFVNGVNNTVVTIDPDPPSADVPAEACTECSVLVEITREIEPYFIQIVYSGDLAATTRSIGICNPDNINLETVTTPGGEVPAPEMGVLWTGGPSCEANVQGNDAYLAGNVHSNGTIKFQPGGPFSGTCANAPNPSPPPNGGWVFGNMTYSDPSLGNWPDAKIHECDYEQMPGATADPVVCGASCLTSSADDLTNDNDPEEVPAYVDSLGEIIWPAEADWDIIDFQVNGDVYNELYSTDPLVNRWYEVTSVADFVTQYQANGPGGVYYIDGDLQFNNGNLPNFAIEATIVATGQIKMAGVTNDFTGWYPTGAVASHRLAFFGNGGGPAGDCVAKDVQFSTSGANFSGTIFAPWGEAKLSTSGVSAVDACIIGYQTSISSAGTVVTCDPGENATQGSINMMQ